MRSARAVLLSLALLLLAVAPALAKPPMWTVHGKGATIVLFGSVHILPRGIDWEPDGLRRALAQADELWFETPIDPATMLDTAREALAQGLLPPGQSLSALLDEDGRARLARAAQELHVPAAELDHLKPWLAELSVGEAAYARDGATADQGVERQLADAAPKAVRRNFETPQEQIAIFAGASTADQVASLEDSLKDLQDDPGQTKRLIDAWLAADLKGIDKEGVQEMKAASPALFKALLTDRNARWLATLRQRLDAPRTDARRPDRVVVVVGVGHLIGPGGLPALLRAQGLRVDGPKE